MNHLSLGIGEHRGSQSLSPGGVQEVDVPVLCLLWDQLHLGAVLQEVGHAMGAIGMAEAAGVVELSIPQVVEGHGNREAGIEPAGSLIDGAHMPLGRVGVGDQELQASVTLQGAKDYTQHPALAVPGQLIAEPQPGERGTIVRVSIVDELVCERRSAAEGQGSQEAATQEHAESKGGAAWEGVKIMLPLYQSSGHYYRNGAYLKGMERQGGPHTPISRLEGRASF